MDHKVKKELELIRYVRHNILTLTENLTDEQLNRVPERMKNNLIWNLGHMVFTQQVLCYQLGGLQPTIDVAFFSQFAPGTIPEREMTVEEIARIRSVFTDAFEQLATDAQAGKQAAYASWSLPSGISIDGFGDAMTTNAIHEGRHFGVIISLAKLVT